ncbi:ATP-binding protein [Peterkaempfera bronchialis]|uniref:ATP-binding protein n=1 Tax=Peterkaempfera bronchialis TaxID=2126346 RepID=UPI003C2C5708
MIEQPPPDQPVGTRWARWTLDCITLDGVSQLRGFVQAKLTEWDYDLKDEQPFAVTLVVTELVANAAQHGDPRFGMVDLVLWSSGDTVTVLVTDSSRATPQAKTPGPQEERGRGLALTMACSKECGWWRYEPGKTVWAAIGPQPLSEAERRTGTGLVTGAACTPSLRPRPTVRHTGRADPVPAARTHGARPAPPLPDPPER